MLLKDKSILHVFSESVAAENDTVRYRKNITAIKEEFRGLKMENYIK